MEPTAMRPAAPSACPAIRAPSLAPDLARAELLLVELGVQAASREKLLVDAALHDPSAIHDEDGVGAKDRAEAVGDDETRPPGEEGLERLLDQRLERESSDDVASSRISSLGSRRTTRASARRCFSPPESL